MSDIPTQGYAPRGCVIEILSQTCLQRMLQKHYILNIFFDPYAVAILVAEATGFFNARMKAGI